MGVSYYECYCCGNSRYEEYITRITIAGGYDEKIRICDDCRDANMDMSPNDEVDFSDQYEWSAKKGDEHQKFDSFYDLRAFILGGTNQEEDKVYEPHLDWAFGDFSEGCTTKEEAEQKLLELEHECRREVWESFSYHNEEDTIYTPKKEWLQQEYESVTQEIEELQRKRQKLEKLIE